MSSVAYALHDRVAEITLDDGRLNVMSLGFFEALGSALDAAERDGAAAVVLAGRPGAFSAGLDLKLLPTLAAAELHRTLVAFGRTMLRVFTLPIPTVAAVTGHAIGGGAFLALACDRRHLADGPFRLHVNEHSIGLPIPTWALVIAEAAIPSRWHAEAILHARPYAPADALERGLADGVEAPDGVLAAARAAAAPLAALTTAAYATSKTRLRARALAWAEARLEPELEGITRA
jgi:enoyl-CoA hydratase